MLAVVPVLLTLTGTRNMGRERKREREKRRRRRTPIVCKHNIYILYLYITKVCLNSVPAQGYQ